MNIPEHVCKIVWLWKFAINKLLYTFFCLNMTLMLRESHKMKIYCWIYSKECNCYIDFILKNFLTKLHDMYFQQGYKIHNEYIIFSLEEINKGHVNAVKLF